jgi:hypothetical protein
VDIQPIGSNKFLVGLSREDLKELDITYETMDYSDIETRRVIWTILECVRNRTGRDIDPSGNLIIEASPDGKGGCILLFTVPASRSVVGTVISKNSNTHIFEFSNADALLDALSAIGYDDSSLRIFTDGKNFRAEMSSEIFVRFRHIAEEFGTYIGSDSITVALTHEHFAETKQSTS